MIFLFYRIVPWRSLEKSIHLNIFKSQLREFEMNGESLQPVSWKEPDRTQDSPISFSVLQTNSVCHGYLILHKGNGLLTAIAFRERFFALFSHSKMRYYGESDVDGNKLFIQ